MPEHAEQADQQGRAGRAGYIVVAINGDGFAGQYSLCDALRRAVHVVELGRIWQECTQARAAVASEILAGDTAGEQKLSDNVVFEAGGAAFQLHVPAAPAPGSAS